MELSLKFHGTIYCRHPLGTSCTVTSWFQPNDYVVRNGGFHRTSTSGVIYGTGVVPLPLLVFNTISLFFQISILSLGINLAQYLKINDISLRGATNNIIWRRVSSALPCAIETSCDIFMPVTPGAPVTSSAAFCVD